MTLSDRFFADVARLGQRHTTDPAIYLNVWGVESGLKPSAVNHDGGARGLNQMMPATLRGLGAPEAFETLSGEEQLPWIERLITAHEALNTGPFLTAARYYHANFFPRTLKRGTASDAIVVALDAADPQERDAYAHNRGLDVDRDGFVTVRDLADVLERVRAQFADSFARLERAVAALPPPGITWSVPKGGHRRRGVVLGVAAALGFVGLARRRRR